MKNVIIIKVFVGLILFCLSVFQVNGANADMPAFEIPDFESNLVVVAVGFRKTESFVNGLNVPIFTTDTNVLGRMDTGTLFCVVSPKQFANTFFVVERYNDEKGGLSVLMPSYHAFKTGRFYQISYSIMDLGFGEGTNMYFNGGGELRFNAGTPTQGNAYTSSNLQTAGDYSRTRVKRYYVSAEEAKAELAILRPKVGSYEKRLNEIGTAIKNELDRRETEGIQTPSINLGDETDKYSMLKKEQYRILPQHGAAKSEMLNAEKQLNDFLNKKPTSKGMAP